jgi:hypothetical protein
MSPWRVISKNIKYNPAQTIKLRFEKKLGLPSLLSS